MRVLAAIARAQKSKTPRDNFKVDIVSEPRGTYYLGVLSEEISVIEQDSALEGGKKVHTSSKREFGCGYVICATHMQSDMAVYPARIVIQFSTITKLNAKIS